MLTDYLCVHTCAKGVGVYISNNTNPEEDNKGVMFVFYYVCILLFSQWKYKLLLTFHITMMWLSLWDILIICLLCCMYVVSFIYFTICHYIYVNFTVQYIKTGKIAPLLFRNE